MSFFYGMHVMVTGSEGLMGRPLVKALESQGAEVLHYDKTDGFDIMDLNNLKLSMAEQDVVFHLAAYSGVEHARELGYEAWRINTMGTLNVLEAARATMPKAVLTASTNHVYGKQTAHERPTSEDARLSQLDTYSASKIAADYMARSYWHNYKVPAVAMRNTNCYGPDDPHVDHIIPGTITSILEGKRPVIRGVGITSKSYLYVDDVVDAYLAVAQWTVENGVGGHAFNVSTEPITVKDLVTEILSVMNSSLQPVIEGKRSDNQNEDLDWGKIHRMTGWKPKVRLRDGIEKVVNAFALRYLKAMPR